jgi:ABC-type phosphate transport system substrate-binding protein
MARGVAVVLVLLVLLAPAAAEEPRMRIAVVVHPSRTVEITADALRQIYLRRKRFWEDGAPIVPLNLAAGMPLRDAFSRRVLGESEARIADYWNRQYFYGVLPPATLASTQAVLRYVASDPNAVGYVAAADVDDSVRTVLSLP